MILSGQTIKELSPFHPFEPESKKAFGRSYGVSHSGYDVRLGQDVFLWPKGFRLASTLEFWSVPKDCMALVLDKSTNARLGLSLFNTCAEAGWNGHLTLEIVNNSWRFHSLKKGTPIAQIVFMKLDRPVVGYDGKYQCAGAFPQGAIFQND